MPEHPDPKVRPHPAKRDVADAQRPPRAHTAIQYAELAVTSNFTFLKGASHPEEFVEQAAALGYTGAAIADRNTLAGIVRAHVAAKEISIPLAVGSRVVLSEPKGVSMLLFASSRASYARLCSLLTLGKRRAAKGECRLSLHDLLDHQEGLLCVWLAPETIDQQAIEICEGLARTFDDDRFSIGVAPVYTGEDEVVFAQIDALCARIGAPMAAINDVRHHCAERKALQDVLTCIREGCTLETAGHRLAPNAERHLKSPEEMARLFAAYPQAIARSAAVCARAVAFNLDELRYEYPQEVCPPGLTPDQHLRNLTYAGAAARYPQGVPKKVRERIDHELTLIGELEYAKYFLTVYEIVRFARQREIVCQGRGAAANSAVCYCLGVTSVDPDRIDLLFERFVSKERDEPPDIDIDFEHERREEVIQYIYQTSTDATGPR